MIKGSRLRLLRTESGLSAEDLAKSLNMTKQQILRYEGEKSDCTTTTLMSIADFFGVSTDFLLGRTTDRMEGDNALLRSKVDITALLRVFPPERVVGILKGIGVSFKLKSDVIDVNDLLNEFPPAFVARFLKGMGIEPQFKYEKPDPDS
jgi:transcriptional regulator with XRE-family HTH domain